MLAGVPTFALVAAGILLVAGTAFAVSWGIRTIAPAVQRLLVDDEAIQEALSDYALAQGDYLAGDGKTYQGSFTDSGSYTVITDIDDGLLSWYVADLDDDGQSELLIISAAFDVTDGDGTEAGSADDLTSAFSYADLAVYEIDSDADASSIEQAATYRFENGSLANYPQACLLWGVYERDGRTYIGFESWSSSEPVRDFTILKFAELSYGSDGIELVSGPLTTVAGSSSSELVEKLESELGVSVDESALEAQEETVLEDYFDAELLRIITTEVTVSDEVYEEWLGQATEGEELPGLSTSFERPVSEE